MDAYLIGGMRTASVTAVATKVSDAYHFATF